MAGQISMGARREVVLAVAERYRLAGRAEKGRILDELCKVTGWHRKHAVRALGVRSTTIVLDRPRRRKPTYGSIIKDAVVALWEASDRVCGKRLKVMIPTLLPALERHGRLELSKADRASVLEVSATTIDRQLVDTKIAAAGGKRRRVGFYSAIRREVPIRTFNDWNNPAPGFCEVDMVAHGGTSVAGAFIQTLTMVDVATGWTECMPLVTRESGLVVQAMERAQSLFPWLVLGADFDNDSAFMNDVVVPWCREQKIEVTRSRASWPAACADTMTLKRARSSATSSTCRPKSPSRNARSRCASTAAPTSPIVLASSLIGKPVAVPWWNGRALRLVQ